jgi:hypothetical protein
VISIILNFEEDTHTRKENCLVLGVMYSTSSAVAVAIRELSVPVAAETLPMRAVWTTERVWVDQVQNGVE